MPIKVFDFFSGCGGTSRGFVQAGLDSVFALDFDHDAVETFRANFAETHIEKRDIRRLKTKAISELIEAQNGEPILFCGCAPCQPFTKQNTTRVAEDDRAPLLNSFSRFVRHYRPHYVFIENVPGMQKVKKGGPFDKFCRMLKSKGYSIATDVVAAQDYGVPQRRRRLVLIASRVGDVALPAPTHGPKAGNNYSTVGEWIGHFPAINAGDEHPDIPNHRAAQLSPTNLERIQVTPVGGDRRDWPDHLQLDCHRNYDGHVDVYGRMKWDAPATGLTTRCISLSNGRFGHPEQNRAISVREAAALQTFPDDFVFSGSLNSQAKQIGNAVPTKLAEVVGRYVIEHWENNRHG